MGSQAAVVRNGRAGASAPGRRALEKSSEAEAPALPFRTQPKTPEPECPADPPPPPLAGSGSTGGRARYQSMPVCAGVPGRRSGQRGHTSDVVAATPALAPLSSWLAPWRLTRIAPMEIVTNPEPSAGGGGGRGRPSPVIARSTALIGT